MSDKGFTDKSKIGIELNRLIEWKSPEQVQELLTWSLQRTSENESEIGTLREENGALVRGIPEWCAQADSSRGGVAGKKRKAPEEDEAA